MTAAPTFSTPGIRWETWTEREARILRETIADILSNIEKWSERLKK